MTEGPESRETIWEGLDAELVARLQATPADRDAWEALADAAARQERPEAAAALGRRLLARGGEEAAGLVEPVLRFHEEWFGDADEAWPQLLSAGLRLAPDVTEPVLARLTMGLTDAERWDELFTLYDAACSALDDEEARARFLEEAAQAAKDFADRPERAVDYYERLVLLRPEDARLAETLERLLHRLGRWQALIARWRERLPSPEADEGLALRRRLAEALLEHLGDAAGAVDVLLEGGDVWRAVPEAVAFLETLSAREDLPAEPRARASWALARWHVEEGRIEAASSGFERAASLGEASWRLEVLEAWGAALHEAERWDEALRVRGWQLAEQAAAGRLEAETMRLGREAADRVGRLEAWAEQLIDVAERLDGALRRELLEEAAGVLSTSNPERALRVLEALEEGAEPSERVALWTRRVELLESLGREEDALHVLGLLVAHHEEAEARRPWLVRAVRRAEQLGRWEQVAALWRAEAERLPADEEAFAAWLDALERTEQWEGLAEALRWRLARADLAEGERRRFRARLLDLLEGPVDDLEGARALAEEALREEGGDARGVDRLARILSALDRRDDLEALWVREAERAQSRLLDALAARASLRERAGDASGAVSILDRLLRLLPGHREAVDALERWLDDERAGSAAVATLARDARDRGEGLRWASFVPRLMETAPDPSARARLLGEALQIWEAHGDRERAHWARQRLAEAAEEAGRWAEALDFGRRLLSDASGPEEWTARALRCAELFERFEREGSPESWLAEVLEREPGHQAALHMLERRFARQGRWAELLDRCEELAARLEQGGDVEGAAVLWRQVAEGAEERLADPARAAAAWRRLAALASSADVFAHLARLADQRGEPSQAAHWLERWWREHPEEAGAPVAARLSSALSATGRPERAMDVLRTALAEHPEASVLRTALEATIEALEAPRARAEAMLLLARHVEGEEAAALALRSAEVLQEEGEDATLAEALAVAHRWLPDDLDVAIRYAEAAARAGGNDAVRAVLDGLFERFGRRRTPLRARAHRLAARLAEAEGDLEAAQAQLEAASEVDRSDPETLRALARLARRRGDLDRAERVYRSLLLAVRRARGELPWTLSELMWELSSLARQRGEQEQAVERLESALAAAERDDREAVHLARAAMESSEYEVALRALDARHAAAGAEPSVELLQLRAEVLRSLGRSEEAFEQALEALRVAPLSEAVRSLARRLAREAGSVERVLDAMRSAAEGLGDVEGAAGLWLAVAAVAEEDLDDAEVALDAVRRAQAVGAGGAESWLRLARLARRRGERDLQRKALGHVAEDDSAPPGARAEALRQLAASAPAEVPKVVSLLRRALELDPDPAPCLDVLLRAVEQGADGEDFAGLYGEVARAMRDDSAWLAYLRWRAERPGAGVQTVREALQEAERQGDGRASEALLERLVEVAAAETDTETAREAMLKLASRREDAGDVQGAVAWMQQVLEVTEEGPDRFELRLRLAALASREPSGQPLARSLYEELIALDPTEERVWSPLLALLRARGEEDALREWVERVTEAVLDPEARNRARMQLAGFYLDRGEDRMAEAIAVLRHVVDEEPDHEEGVGRLTELYERAGYEDELADLLWRRLDAALDGGDAEAALRVGSRLGGALSASGRRQDAVDVYRRLLDADVADRFVLERYLELLQWEEEPDLVLEAAECLLLLEEGEEASLRARWLAERHAERGDEESRRRVLRLGLERAPHDEALAEALARAAADDGDPEALVALLLSRAERGLSSDPDAARAAFLEAAQVRLERLGDVDGASAVLTRAREIWPKDIVLLGAEVELLRRGGRDEEAVERLDDALARYTEADAGRAELLRCRAELAIDAQDWATALRALDEAITVDSEGSSELLVRALVGWRTAVAGGGDVSAEREATLRLAAALERAGDVAQAHELLRVWTLEHTEDTEVLAARERLERAHGLRESLLETLEMALGLVEEPDALQRAAIELLKAAEDAERPEAARRGLEAAVQRVPGDETLFSHLLALYERIGAYRDRGMLLLERAARAEERGAEQEAFDALRGAGESLTAAGEPEAATDALRRAAELRPEDSQCVVALADALASWGQFSEAARALQEAIERHPRRRSPELGALQHAMARLARQAGDPVLEYQWLQAAFEADKQNLAVASELAERAVAEGDADLAMKALRAVTMGRGEGPMSRGRAYLLQAKVALQQGEGRRALLYARKAKSEEPSLPGIDEVLQELGG